MTDLSSTIIVIAQSVPGFLFAVCIHEAAHAWMANRFGDDTAKNAGRLTLNPVAHADPMGTVVLPLVFAFMGFAVIGWAKPVPVDARRFNNIKRGVFWVSFAGPLSNFLTGILCALVYAIVTTKLSPENEYYSIARAMLNYSIFINFILGAFNLIPLPPLDGSRMVSTMLSYENARKYEELGRYTNFIFMGALMLSFAGVPVFRYILAPALFLGNFITNIFVFLFQ